MKNFSFLVIFSTIFYFNVFSQSGAITNIVVSQRADGSGLIDVHYNLSGSGTTYYISMEASFNNGVTFNPVASSFLSGNIGTVLPGTNKHIIWNGKGSNNNTYSTQAKVKLIANTDIPCGQSLTVNHIAGEVAPVTKTTTYGTVTGIPGEPTKCWITSNLGSDHQATSVDDATEASAGWYWQFNRKQGYKHDGLSLIPPWTNININENADWQMTSDPCNLELGTTWRIPSYTEWYNLDNVGGWTYWYGPWYSGLKLHEAGNLDAGNGTLSVRGSIGHYWSSNQGDSFGGWVWDFSASYSGTGYADKNYGYSLRCVKDECIIPQIPLQGIHIPSQNQVIWNWSSVNAAVGYKWNTTNDYTTATEMGTDTTKTETGLTSNTFYTRYVWAYNECGVSNVSILTNQTTEFIIGQNFGGGIIFYIDSTGQHGLIAAPSDQSYGAQWGCYGTILWNSSTAIGTGQTNTTAIVNGCSEQGIPARICNDLVLNGYSDWFLPSKEELDLMYSQRIVIGGFMSIYYWSSSEYSSIQAWGSNFYDGIQYPFSKDNGSILVRAVRAF